ncbi:hypothetical protein K439DRAFT_478308 [Ramaria rubella]|nr:hypothetical protein K439DRAFT_478308 [Ramaria rubella]
MRFLAIVSVLFAVTQVEVAFAAPVFLVSHPNVITRNQPAQLQKRILPPAVRVVHENAKNKINTALATHKNKINTALATHKKKITGVANKLHGKVRPKRPSNTVRPSTPTSNKVQPSTSSLDLSRVINIGRTDGKEDEQTDSESINTADGNSKSEPSSPSKLNDKFQPFKSDKDLPEMTFADPEDLSKAE